MANDKDILNTAEIPYEVRMKYIIEAYRKDKVRWAKQLQHCMRASKATKGLVVSDIDLINFPQNRFQMDLYYDGECFIYTDGLSKFIVHPNYMMKICRDVAARVNFITATKVKDPAEFTLPKYRRI